MALHLSHNICTLDHHAGTHALYERDTSCCLTCLVPIKSSPVIECYAGFAVTIAYVV
jgi:hypothetical protein